MSGVLSGQRIAVLVDVQNVFYSAKHQHRARLNYGRALEWVVGDRRLVRAIAYVVRSPEVDQAKFLTMLRGVGFETRVKELRVRGDGTAHGDWDMGMALDALALAPRVDTLCLWTGDGDFVELVEVLKGQGVRVEVYAFRPSTAEELMQAATAFFEIGPDLLIVSPEAGAAEAPPTDD